MKVAWEPIEFFSNVPEKDQLLLMKLGNRYGFDPLDSQDAEDYFMALLGRYQGPPEGKLAFLEEEVSRAFHCCGGSRPVWIQGAEWPFENGKPMWFVGQLETDVENYGSAFYVFWNRDSGTGKTVMQCD